MGEREVGRSHRTPSLEDERAKNGQVSGRREYGTGARSDQCLWVKGK
jgi:hypothetical protein